MDHLCRTPSRASVAALGHAYVLNGAPPALSLMAIDAITRMICDWTVVILEETVNDRSLHKNVRRYALNMLGALLSRAVSNGYHGLARFESRRLLLEARQVFEEQLATTGSPEIQPVEELCNHLSQAVSNGVFGELPDF
jgi:hypothetical protein